MNPSFFQPYFFIQGLGEAGAGRVGLDKNVWLKNDGLTMNFWILDGFLDLMKNIDMSSTSGYMCASYFLEFGPIFWVCHVPNVACHGVSISIVSISSVSCRVRILRVSVSMPCRGHPGCWTFALVFV